MSSRGNRHLRETEEKATGVVMASYVRVFFRVLGGLCGFVAVVALLAVSGPGRLLVAAALGVFAFLAWGQALSEVELTQSGVIIRNYFRRISVPWSDFARFALIKDGVRWAGYVETREGRTIRCAVLTPGGQRPAGEEFQSTVDRLNQVADRLRNDRQLLGSVPTAFLR